MSRVLMSFLGTGPLEGESEGVRNYKNAIYKVDNKEYKTPFVSAALSEHLQIDKRIIIGTVKSMWEEYYRFFYSDKPGYDKGLYDRLIKFTDNARASTVEYDILNELEDKMEDTHLIIIKYGLNEEELRENISRVLDIEKLLNKKDGLYVDVTHGFRSFPLLAQQVIFYMKEVSSKNIKPRAFYYGMHDANRELGYAPIIDLSIMLEMNEWLLGANQLKTSTNASKIINLLKKKDEKTMEMLDSFTKALNINYVNEIKNQIDKLSSFETTNLKSPEKLIIEKVINEFLEHFRGIEKQSKFQFELAKWYYSKNNYGSAYISLAESIITLVCENNNLSTISEKDRNQAKGLLNNTDFKNRYKTISNIRNNIAHSLKKRPYACNQDIEDFNVHIRILSPNFNN